MLGWIAWWSGVSAAAYVVLGFAALALSAVAVGWALRLAWGLLRLLGLSSGAAITALVVMGTVAALGFAFRRDIADYRYFLEWRGYGQYDACVGYHAARGLKDPRERHTLRELWDICERLLESRAFRLGYPEEVWEKARELGVYPLGYTLRPG